MQKLHFHKMFTNSHYYTTFSHKVCNLLQLTQHVFIESYQFKVIQNYNLDHVHTFSLKKIYSRLGLQSDYNHKQVAQTEFKPKTVGLFNDIYVNVCKSKSHISPGIVIPMLDKESKLKVRLTLARLTGQHGSNLYSENPASRSKP